MIASPAQTTSTATAAPGASIRRWTLHLPARWPWQHDFTTALERLRALPAAA